MTSPAQTLRAALAAPAPVLAPGVFDALSALLVEQAGFGCAYLSGASVAYTKAGRPDIGLMSFTEVADTIAHIRERVAIPLVVDADTGFGNALNVQRTVKLFERMGATAIQLEDQLMPKRCGHLAGKTLISKAEMVGKIKAALDARADAATLIVARTDAIGVEGFEAALDRAEAFVEAGCDVLFVEAPQGLEQMRTVTERFAAKVPLLANMVEGGQTPINKADELAALGFKLVIFPGALVRVQTATTQAFLADLKTNGSTLPWRERMLDLKGINRVVGTDAMLDAGRAYDSETKGAGL